MRTLFVAALVVVSALFVLLGQSRPGEQPARVTASPQQPAPQAFIDKLLDMANVGPNDCVVDLASRDARIVIAAAKRGAHGVGLECSKDVAGRARIAPASKPLVTEVESRASEDGGHS